MTNRLGKSPESFLSLTPVAFEILLALARRSSARPSRSDWISQPSMSAKDEEEKILRDFLEWQQSLRQGD